MFTKQQLNYWKSLGFHFPGIYDQWARESSTTDPSILSVSILNSGKSSESYNYAFTLQITLNVPTYFDYGLVIKIENGFAETPYQKNRTFNDTTYYADCKIAMSLAMKYKVFDVTVDVEKSKLSVDNPGKIVSKRALRILVQNDGKITVYNNEPLDHLAEKTVVTVSQFTSIFGDKPLFSHRNMKAFPDVYNIKKQTFVDSLNKNLPIFEINSALRLAHFFGQVEHESDHLNTTQEYASGSAYEGREDLGNTVTGDGKKFRGRGLIQLTGRDNYSAYTTYYSSQNENGIDFTVAPNNLLLASNIEIAVNVSGWYWQVFKSLNDYADADDLIFITYKVNGGFNGYTDRKEKLLKAITVLGAELGSEVNKELGVYKVSESVLYGRFLGMNRWAQYHDSTFPKLDGTGKDAEEAKSAYARVIELYDAGKVKQTKDNLKIYEAAKKRYNLL